jgi:hypothetical protein
LKIVLRFYKRDVDEEGGGEIEVNDIEWERLIIRDKR